MASTGIRIRARREQLKMTRSGLAKALGISRLKVWRVETGEVKVPSDDLRVWAKALKTRAARLLP
jgi:transcriptional regulator with XRE-family HTH domain